MYRTFPYLLLFAATVLLQVFFFDNLSVSIYLSPLIYVAFVALLPLDTPHVGVLLGGLAVGMVMDWAMGTAGINTIATVFVAFLRPYLLRMICRRDDTREEGIPSAGQLGKGVFLNYLIVLVLIHHLVFFSLSALSWTHILHTLLRLAVSSAVTVAFIWLIARLFTSKVSVRV